MTIGIAILLGAIGVVLVLIGSIALFNAREPDDPYEIDNFSLPTPPDVDHIASAPEGQRRMK